MLPETTLETITALPKTENIRLYTTIGLLLVFIMAARSPIDSDMWWHLSAGRWMVEHGSILLKDVFSYTRPGETWISQAWLSEVILFLFYRIGGLKGMSFFTASLAVLSLSLLYPRMSGHSLFKGFLLVLLAPVAGMVWSPRPQMFSLALLALLAILLDQYATGRQKKMWLVLPLFILWSNLHAGYALGLILMGAVIAGAILDHVLGRENETISYRQTGLLALWMTGAWAVTAINPNGVKTWLIPFITVNIGSLQELISEWASPDFHDPRQAYILVVLLLAIFAIGRSSHRISGIEFATLAVFTSLALIARRNYAAFAIIAGPILSTHLWQVLVDWRHRLEANQGRLIYNENPTREMPVISNRLRMGLNIALVVLLAGVGLAKLSVVSSQAFLDEPMRQVFPVDAAVWIEQNTSPGRLLSTYGWGGYLSWTIPEYPIFLDGRTDLYGDEIIEQWLSVVQARPGWQQILERWQVKSVLLEPGTPLLTRLAEVGWNTLYLDATAVVMQAP